MTPDTWKLIASVGGVLIAAATTITGPIIFAMHAEAKAMRAEFKYEIAQLELRLNERIDQRIIHR